MALPYRWQSRIDRWKNSFRGFFGGNQQSRPKLCPACGTLVGMNATRCHECGTSLTFSLPALSKKFGGAFGGHAPVTTVLMIVNILMFGLTLMRTMSIGQGGGLSILWGMSGEALYRFGANLPFDNGWVWWRSVTAMFLHGGLIHIGFNIMVLMDIGPVVEEVYGSARFLFLYLATGVGGFLLSAWRTESLAIGASTALMGLIGIMIAITTKRGGSSMKALQSRLISWVVSTFVIGFAVPGIDNWGHLGGLATGFALGKIFADREPVNSTERKQAYALGWLAGIVIIASFTMMVLHFRDSLD